MTRGDVLAAAVLLVFTLALCWPVASNRVPIASDTLGLWAPWSQVPHAQVKNTTLADSALLYLPWMVHERSSIAQGEWPLWDPATFAGFPFAANSQNQLYYPPTWLGWMLPLGLAIQSLAVFSVLLAGTGMYALCRVLGVSAAGSLIAGLAFMGSGMLQTAIDIPGITSVYAWLPWLLLATELAIRNRSLLWTGAAAVLCGVATVSGQLQWALYIYFATGCWVVWRAAEIWRPDLRRPAGNGAAATIALTRGVGILLAGLLMASVHLGPFAELVGFSGRTAARASSHSDPLYYLLMLLMPGLFGSPTVVPGYPLTFNNVWYVGIPALVLAAAALVFKRARVTWFWALLALYSVLVTYGIGPFLLVRWLPGLSATVPSRIGYLFIGSMCVLTGLGWDGLVRARRRVRGSYRLFIAIVFGVVGAVMLVVAAGLRSQADWLFRSIDPQYRVALQDFQALQWIHAALVTAGLFAALAAFYLAPGDTQSRRRGTELLTRSRGPASAWAGRLLPAAIVAIIALDLLSVLPGYSSWVAAGDLAPSAPSLSWLAAQTGQWRVMPVDAAGPSLVPNSHLLESIQSVDGYDSLHPQRYDQFWAAVDLAVRGARGAGPYATTFVRPQAYTSTLAALLGARYVMASGPLAAPLGFRREYTGEVTVLQNLSALPRVFLVANSRVMPARDVLNALSDPGFEPGREVLLEAGTASETRSADSGAPGSARIALYRNDTVRISADATRSSWLVLADANYPGWSATVDGNPTAIFTADYILRAVRLSPGHHDVVFYYLPTHYWAYLSLSLAALAAAVAAIVVAIVGARRKGNS